MTTALEGGEGSASRPGCSIPPGKTRYQMYRRLGGPQGRSGQVQKISPPPPRFDPRTVQPVASRYTDYATEPIDWITIRKMKVLEFISNRHLSSLSIKVRAPFYLFDAQHVWNLSFPLSALFMCLYVNTELRYDSICRYFLLYLNSTPDWRLQC